MKKKRLDIIEFSLWAGIVILINIIASQYFFRIDLTEDDRYTISETSREVLEGLEDNVFVDVYLTGNLPGDYKRLENSVREMLDEFRVYAGEKVKYRFFDPNQEENETNRARVFQYLKVKGINPVGISTKEGEKYIFPAAVVSYKENDKPVLLLNTNAGVSEAEMVNQSLERLEYELISSIKALTIKTKKTVAFVEGHGELDAYSTFDVNNALGHFYNTYRINLNQVKSLENYDALIIAAPTAKYSEEEKYKLDQYIMKGGKVLFFLDPVMITLDSLRENETVAVQNESNLEDLIFKYGLRVNSNLIQDLQAMPVPMVIGEIQGKPQMRQVPFRYYPLLNNFSDHITVKNIGVILSKFVGSLTEVKAEGVNKIPLVSSSKYVKVFEAPLRVDLNDSRTKPDPDQFNKGPLPVAYLLEGKFTSLYKNRPLSLQDSSFVGEGKKSQVFVCADGDIIKNVQERKGSQVEQLPLPAGNKDLVLNVVDYMLNEQGLINLRAKEIALRPLDKERVRDERLNWQIINLVVPVLLIIAFGIARYYYRKKKYTNF